MKLNFHRLEKRIQSFVENNAILLPWADPRVKISQQLTRAMEEGIALQEDGTILAPNKYVIHLANEDFQHLKKHEEILHTLAENLFQGAKEAGISMRSTPTIMIEINADLSRGDIQLEAAFIVNDPSQTAVLNLETNTELRDRPGLHRSHLIIDGAQYFSLDKPVINIGRRSDNDLVIDDPRVSRTHAQLRLVQDNYVLFDLNTTGGTYVNDRPIHQVTLQSGDVISLAGVMIVYSEDLPTNDNASTETKEVNSGGDGEI